jgi:hypothetical protein
MPAAVLALAVCCMLEGLHGASAAAHGGEVMIPSKDVYMVMLRDVLWQVAGCLRAAATLVRQLHGSIIRRISDLQG